MKIAIVRVSRMPRHKDNSGETGYQACDDNAHLEDTARNQPRNMIPRMRFKGNERKKQTERDSNYRPWKNAQKLTSINRNEQCNMSHIKVNRCSLQHCGILEESIWKKSLDFEIKVNSQTTVWYQIRISDFCSEQNVIPDLDSGKKVIIKGHQLWKAYCGSVRST